MQIETYEIEDATSEASAMAKDSAALELIEKLGLTGQLSLMNKETVTRVPYRAMEKAELLVYLALCDQKTAIEKYNADAIPVRVLQCAAFAKETEMFKTLQIWYPSIAKIDDPVLVGTIEKRLYPDDERYANLTSTVYYMLARWGNTLLPFEQLEAMAVKMLKTRRQAALAKAFAETKTAMAALEDTNDLEVLSAGVSFSC